MLIDFVFDLIRFIRHKDTAVRVARAHFCLRSLESGEEFRMDESRLGILELGSNVPCQPEVRILIDSARN